MNNLLQNQVGCDLMIWESAPKRRNKNNQVKFVVPSHQEVKVGDVIIGNYSVESISCYEITEIKNRREASINKKDYLTVLTRWSNKRPDFKSFNLITNNTFNKLFFLN